MRVLWGKLGKTRRGNVRRIGHDNLVLGAARRIEIRIDESDTIRQAEGLRIRSSDLERRSGHVRRIDPQAGAVIRRCKCQAAATRAYIEETIAGLDPAPRLEA